MTSILQGYFLLILYALAVFGEDVPCAQKQVEFGFVCVCNSSYCDTVERPAPLSKDQYYLYTTGKLSPGISRSIGNFLHSNSNGSSIVFNIDSNVKHQEILGFGGSFTDSSAMVVAALPQGAQDNFVESYFGEKGVEYSLGRAVAGGSDFSTRIYTYDDHLYDDNLSHFALQEEDIKYKIPLIKKAMDVSPHDIRLLASPYYPPYWMKLNEQYSSMYIRRRYLDLWAKYLIKFLDSYAEHGINYWLLSEGNEVAMGYSIGQQQPLGVPGWALNDRYFVKEYLGPQLRASNHSTKYVLLDDQRVFARYYMNRFAADPEVSEMTAGVALHWYWDWLSSYDILDNLHNEHPDKLIIYSESSINVILFAGQAVQIGDWGRGAYYLYNIIDNFNHWANAYIDWNLALNMDGGPDIGIELDAAVLVNATSGEFFKNPIFYAMGIFSKFIPPGAFRVNVTSTQNHADTSNQWRELWKRYLEQKERKQAPTPTLAPIPTFPPRPPPVVPQDVHCLATTNPDNSTTVVLFNAMDEEADVTVVDAKVGRLVTTIPAQTVHTLVYWP